MTPGIDFGGFTLETLDVCFLCRRAPVNLGLSEKFLDHGGNTLCVNLDTQVQICIFFSGGPKAVRPIHILKIRPIAIFLLLTELTLFHPWGF